MIPIDHCDYVWRCNEKLIIFSILLLYENDKLLAGNYPNLMLKTKPFQVSKFEMKDRGPTTYVLPWGQGCPNHLPRSTRPTQKPPDLRFVMVSSGFQLLETNSSESVGGSLLQNLTPTNPTNLHQPKATIRCYMKHYSVRSC